MGFSHAHCTLSEPAADPQPEHCKPEGFHLFSFHFIIATGFVLTAVPVGVAVEDASG